LSILCPRCGRKRPLRECPPDIKETNKCSICAENHATKNVPPHLGLVVIEGGQPKVESLRVEGA